MATIVSDLVSHLQCGEAISANDAVYIDSSDGKIYKFTPTDDTQTFAGIAKEAGVLNDFIRVSQSGRIKGFTGLIPGAFVYASVTVPGSFQLVEPAPSQKVILGIAKSATELIINGGLGIKPGGDGGGGGLDAYYIENMEGLANVSDFATGNNATFLGGGSLQGSLVIDDVAPISGLKSLKYTQAAGSLNDYFASDIINIDLKQQNNTSGMTLYFEYDGNDNDMCFVVWDVTNNQRLSSEVAFVKKTGKAQRYSLSFYVPTSCTQIRWGAQVLVENIGAELVIDDVEMSTDPFMYKDLVQTQQISGSGSGTTINFATGSTSSGGGLFSASGNTITALKKINVTASVRAAYTASAVGQYVTASVTTPAGGFFDSYAARAIGEGITVNASTSYILEPGQTITLGVGSNVTPTHNYSIVATASTSHVLTPSDTFSTDTAPLTWAAPAQYNLSTLANAPIGTYITFQYAASTNTRTQCTTRPTQTDADMNVNGMRIFTRAYNAASTAAQPAAFAIQIGKGLKGTSLGLYKSAGKVVAGNLDHSYVSSTTNFGAQIKDYNEVTGILTIDAGVTSPSVTVKEFLFSDTTSQTSGYLTINASKSSSLTAVPTPLVAYLKDVKASGTAGGTFTAGSWQTRTLNTVEGDTSFVTLNANQFVLGPGRYEIEASVPAYRVLRHQAKLRNVTNSIDSILGSSEYSLDTGDSATNVSKIVGSISVTSTTTFEIQHQAATTRATNGFGVETSFGVNVVYSIVKIKKVG